MTCSSSSFSLSFLGYLPCRIFQYKQAIKRKREFELANLEQGVVFPEGMFSAEGGGHYWKAYNDEDEQPLYRVMFPGFGAAGQDREGDISTEEDMMSMVSSPMVGNFCKSSSFFSYLLLRLKYAQSSMRK